jgi:hypothetical protein
MKGIEAAMIKKLEAQNVELTWKNRELELNWVSDSIRETQRIYITDLLREAHKK